MKAIKTITKTYRGDVKILSVGLLTKADIERNNKNILLKEGALRFWAEGENKELFVTAENYLGTTFTDVFTRSNMDTIYAFVRPVVTVESDIPLAFGESLFIPKVGVFTILDNNRAVLNSTVGYCKFNSIQTYLDEFFSNIKKEENNNE